MRTKLFKKFDEFIIDDLQMRACILSVVLHVIPALHVFCDAL